jgi:hypothetical protein
MSDPSPDGAEKGRGMLKLAGVGAFLAGGYWALVTLLTGVGVAAGSVSGFQIILPVVLIFLYVTRGYQIIKGNRSALRSILGLHAIGGLFAVVNALSGSPFVAVLHGIKVVIHIFGGLTAYLAWRAPDQST